MANTLEWREYREKAENNGRLVDTFTVLFGLKFINIMDLFIRSNAAFNGIAGR